MAKQIKIGGLKESIDEWQKATVEVDKNKKSLESLLMVLVDINGEFQKTKGLKEFVKSQEKLEANQKKLQSQIERYSVALKEQDATEKRLIKQIEKKNIAGESTNRQLIKERLETQRLNKSIKEETILKSKSSSLIQKVTILRLRESRIIQDLNIKRELGNKLSRTEAIQLARSEKQFEKYNKAIRVARNATGQFQENVGNYPKLFGNAVTAVGRLLPLLGASLTFGAVFDFASEARQLAIQAKGVEFAFNQIGVTAVDAFERVKKSTRGLLSDLDIKKSIVEFDNFGLSLAETDTLFEFLSVRAAQTGQSVDKLRDSLVEGLSKESKLRIDNLGISASELNAELEKTPDFVQAVANIAKREVAEAGSILDDAANSQDKWNAQLENFKLLVGNGFVSRVSGFFFDLGTNILRALTPSESLTDQFIKQRNNVESLEKSVSPLLDRYDELSVESERTTKEQKELDDIILQVAKDIPSAITQFDEYGKALGINTEAARKFVNQQKQILLIQNSEAIDEQVESLSEVNKEIELITNTLNGLSGGYRGIVKQNGELFRQTVQGGKVAFIELDKIENGIEKFQAKLRDLQNERLGREGILADLRGEKTQEQIDAELAAEDEGDKKLTEQELEALRKRAERTRQERERLTQIEADELLALNIFRLEQEAKAQEDILKNEELNSLKRIEAALNIERIRKEILDLSTADQIKGLEDGSAKKILIEEKAGLRRVEIEKDIQNQINNIPVSSNDIPDDPINEGLEQEEEEKLRDFLEREKQKAEAIENTRDALLESFTGLGNALGVGADSIQAAFDLIDGSLESTEEKMLALGSVISGVFQGITASSNRNLQARINDIELERDSALSNASLTEAQRSFLEERFDQRKRQIQRRQAENEKKQALVNSAINTATGVVSALAQVPKFDFGISALALATTIGAIGAVKLGVIAAQPIPEFAVGTQNAPEGVARVGERGAELITDKNRKVKGLATSDSYTYLNKGDKVFTASKTKDILGNTFGFENITKSIALNGLDGELSLNNEIVFNGITEGQMLTVMNKTLAKQPIKNTVIDRHGIKTRYEKGSTIKTLRNSH